MKLRMPIVAMLLIVFTQRISAQDSSSLYNRAFNFPDKLFGSVDKKAEKLQQKFIEQSEKYLKKLSRQEEKLKRKLAKRDSAAAAQLFAGSAETYRQLASRLRSGKQKLSNFKNIYNGHLDSMTTALNFLKDNKLLDESIGTATKLKDALGKMEGLQDQLNKTVAIQQYLKQRQQLLQEQLQKFGMTKQLRSFKKQVYYYRTQMDEYKKIWEDPTKLEAKAMELLSKTTVFKDFFRKHSELGSLFRLPGGSSDPTNNIASLAGLQTRAAVQQDLQQRFGNAPNIQQAIQQNIGDAQSQLNGLKDKLNKLGSGGDINMPDFKPNTQKTKSFLKRLEYGTNLQTAKGNTYFPVTSDLGLSVGYKIDDKKVIGIGASYKMGWGKDIRHISITHQGLGLRSFVDLKIKDGFWISGGGELNYRSQFNDFSVLKDLSPWQKSALLGITKKYQAGKKLKGNVQLLYDFLYKQQVPVTQPVVFRVGYNF